MGVERIELQRSWPGVVDELSRLIGSNKLVKLRPRDTSYEFEVVQITKVPTGHRIELRGAAGTVIVMAPKESDTVTVTFHLSNGS